VSDEKQPSLFDANQTWFRIFQDMIFSGEAAKIGPSGFMVYSVIKAHASLNSGESFPGIPLIAKEGGVSPATVKRELNRLEEMGYLTRSKEAGRNNTYQLRERVQITNEDGKVEAVGWWDYVPMSMQAALTDLKNVTMSGDLSNAKIIHIEHMVVNIQTGPGNQVNFNDKVGEIPNSPLGEQLRKLMNSRRDES
jgi:DNA-binding MarR family transcriptional regulator